MNKRIQELAFNAAGGILSYDEDGYKLPQKEVEKFVELLLKDVLAIVKNNTPDPDPYNEDYDTRAAAERTANDIRDEIKYRFGVSE